MQIYNAENHWSAKQSVFAIFGCVNYICLIITIADSKCKMCNKNNKINGNIIRSNIGFPYLFWTIYTFR